MKTIKTWEQFNEGKKNYTKSDREKDLRRVDDMQAKAKDENHLLRLAQTMANAITNYDKAYNRGMAAEAANLPKVAEIFFKRADELKPTE